MRRVGRVSRRGLFSGDSEAVSYTLQARCVERGREWRAEPVPRSNLLISVKPSVSTHTRRQHLRPGALAGGGRGDAVDAHGGAQVLFDVSGKHKRAPNRSAQEGRLAPCRKPRHEDDATTRLKTQRLLRSVPREGPRPSLTDVGRRRPDVMSPHRPRRSSRLPIPPRRAPIVAVHVDRGTVRAAPMMQK